MRKDRQERGPGEPIRVEDGSLQVPPQPLIPYIEGDGIGPEISKAARAVLDAAVEYAYSGQRRLRWVEIYAGEKARRLRGDLLPVETLEAIRELKVALKGPLATPVGSGHRSLNVTLRQELDLYACVRPIRHLPGVPSPLKDPQDVDFVIFRENTEDVYAGIEWESGSPEARKFKELLREHFGVEIRPDAGVGVKPLSEFGTKRLVRKAIAYALSHGRRRVTLMHKGNIMKYTEGAFCRWGYEVAREEFPDRTITEEELYSRYQGEIPQGKVLVNDRIADILFQHVITPPREFDVIATPNLNGDYLSDACAAQVGGVGMAPGANLGDEVGVFEPTHGTAPDIAGKNVANPTALILSGALLLDHLGWREAAELLHKALARTFQQGRVTGDLARLREGTEGLSTEAFAQAVMENVHTLSTEEEV